MKKQLAIAISVALMSGGAYAAADNVIDYDLSNLDALGGALETMYSGDLPNHPDPDDNVALVKGDASSGNQVMTSQNSSGFNAHISVVDLSNSADDNTVSVTQADGNHASLVKLDNSDENTVTVTQSADSNESELMIMNTEFSDVSVTQTGDSNFSGINLVGADGNSGSSNTITVEQLSNNQTTIDINGLDTQTGGWGTASGNDITVLQQGDGSIADLLMTEINLDTVEITQQNNDEAYVEVHDSWNSQITITQNSDNDAFVTVSHSDFNDVTVDQSGSLNTATVYINSEAAPYIGGNHVLHDQSGDSNVATTTIINGQGNDVDTFQTSDSNTVTTALTDASNSDIDVTQELGSGNVATTTVTGGALGADMNVVDVYQSGADNTATTTIVNANSNNVWVDQIGNDHISEVSIENGDFNDVTVTQSIGNSMAVVSIMDSSNNNGPGLAGVGGIEIVQTDNELAVVRLSNGSNGNAVYISQN